MFNVTMRCFREKSLQVDYTTLQSITVNSRISAPVFKCAPRFKGSTSFNGFYQQEFHGKNLQM